MPPVSRSPLARVRFLLVAPRSPGNVGAAARAVKNMGIGRLDIVEPVVFRDPAFFAAEAARFAAGAGDVLRRVRRFATLEGAVRPSAHLVATSARPARSAPAATPREAATRLVEMAEDREVVVLFGPENRGLPNRLIRRAAECLRIPASPRHPVLNLAQAVIVVGYELFLAAEAPIEAATGPGVPPGELDALAGEAADALAILDFLKPHNRDRIGSDLAALLARARPGRREVRMLRGICRQVRWLGGRAGRGRPG